MLIAGKSLEIVTDQIADDIFVNSKSVYYTSPNLKDISNVLSLVYDNSNAKDIEESIMRKVTEEENSDKYRVDQKRLGYFIEGLRDRTTSDIQSIHELVLLLIKSIEMNWGHIAYWPVNKENKDTLHSDIIEAMVDYVVINYDYDVGEVLSAFRTKTDELLEGFNVYKKKNL